MSLIKTVIKFYQILMRIDKISLIFNENSDTFAVLSFIEKSLLNDSYHYQ